MSFETWLAFTAASIILLLIPGPTVLLVVSYALGQGWRTAFPMAIGVALGDFTAMTLSMLGIGALLAASATNLHGAEMDRRGLSRLARDKALAGRRRARRGAANRAASSAKMLGHAWLVTALNPKSITFFVAFLPQFLDPHASFATQMVIFEATFLVLAFANARLRARRVACPCVRQEPRAIGIVNKVGGTCLIGAGIAAVSVRAGH